MDEGGRLHGDPVGESGQIVQTMTQPVRGPVAKNEADARQRR